MDGLDNAESCPIRLRARSHRIYALSSLRVGSLPGDRQQAATVSRAAQPAGGVKVTGTSVQVAPRLPSTPVGVGCDANNVDVGSRATRGPSQQARY